MTFIVQPEEATGSDRAGGKAIRLAVLQRANLSVPAWFVLSPGAFDASLSGAQRQTLQAATYDTDLSAMVAAVAPCEAVRLELARALAALCPAGERVAVRSSACDEDGTRQSFAGQFDSFLNVPNDEVADRRDVFRMERGRRSVHDLELLVLASALECSTSWLLGGNSTD